MTSRVRPVTRSSAVVVAYSNLFIIEFFRFVREQLTKMNTDSFPVISCYTNRLLSVLSINSKEQEEQCMEAQLSKLSLLLK